MANILIVDDDAQATGLFEKLVILNGHRPLSVNDSTKALDKARLFNPDLILLDLMMPDLDGFELCTLFKNDSRFSKTPIIIISAIEDRDSKTKALQLGAMDYITKPFDITEFTEKTNRLLKLKK